MPEELVVLDQNFNIFCLVTNWFRVNNNTIKRETKEISSRYSSNIWQPKHNVLIYDIAKLLAKDERN